MNKKKIEQIKKASKKYEILPTHAENVSKFSLSIFEQTKDLHSLGNKEQFYLESASWLHDIGKQHNTAQHHKTSMKKILTDESFPFTTNERQIIGNIARYHRRSEPKLKHKEFAKLAPSKQEKVQILSSIIRIADSLDSKHASIIKKIKLNIKPKEIIIYCYALGGSIDKKRTISKRFSKKKIMFEKMFDKKLRIKWIKI